MPVYVDGVRWVSALLLLFTASACAAPATEFTRRALALSMNTEVIRGDSFDHVVFRTPRSASRRIHVYLDGDGTPWLAAGLPAIDPTPRVPLLLTLMTRDRHRSVYLGRPCYHGVVNQRCVGQLWTSGRYSEAVVDSMAAALRSIVDAGGIEEIAWIGYSGGGVLAMLLAARIPETIAVVTVAANLNISEWTRMRGERPLSDSLNPASQAPPDASVYQRHYAGGQDRIVPPAVTQAGARGAPMEVIPAFDHTCCWIDIWSRVLEDLELGIASRHR